MRHRVRRGVLGRLGWRLLWVADRRRTVSVVLVVAGTAAAVLSVLVGLSAFTVVGARSDRAAGRSLTYAERDTEARMWAAVGYHSWRDQLLLRVDVSLSASPPPPARGLSRWPRPGEAFVSPSYARELARHAALASYHARARVAGTVGDAGLRGPDELVVYRGVDRSVLPRGGVPVVRVGGGSPMPTELDTAGVGPLAAAFLACLGLPLCAFLVVAARVSATTRARRLAALRLLGMSVRDARLVNAVELAVSSGLGAVLAVALHPVVNGVVAGSGALGVRWFPADTALTPLAVVTTVATTVGLAVLVGSHAVRSALLTPFAQRRGAPPRSPRAWLLLPLAAGLVSLAVLAWVRYGGHGDTGVVEAAHVLLVAVGVTGVGLLLAPGPLAARCGGYAARRGRTVASRLGGARAAADPGSTSRLAAGLLVLVFASGVLIGFAEDARTTTQPQGRVVQLSVDAAGVAPAERARLLRLPGTVAVSVVHASSRKQRVLLAMVADCGALVRFAGTPFPDCRPGTSYAVREELLGDRLELRVGPGGRATTVAAPTRRLPSGVAANLAPVAAVVSPARADTVPARGQIVFRTARANLDTTMAALVAAAPYGQPDALGLDPGGAEQLRFGIGVVRSAFGLGALVTFLAFGIAALDRTAERRHADTSLLVLGLPTRTLRAAQVWEVALTVGAGLAVATVAGVLGALAWQFTLSSDQTPDVWSLAALVTGAVVAAAASLLVAAAVSTRGIEPGQIRLD